MAKLGRTDIDISPLVLGTNTFGWITDESEAHAVLDALTAAGGDLIDTADSYSTWAPGNSGGESATRTSAEGPCRRSAVRALSSHLSAGHLRRQVS